MASSSTPTTNAPRFQCILTNNPEENQPNNSESALWLEQEEGKKSSFVWSALDDDSITTTHEIAKPCHLLIQTVPPSTFLFGGLEIITNARNIEFYLTGGDDNKETYLTTSRGLKFGEDTDEHQYKCLVVCPGGPRPVTRVHLKLLSLKPASCTGATLHLLKFKGRLPPPQQQQEAASATAQQAAPQPAAASPGLTQADVSHAITGISLMVRSVETSLQQSMQASLDKMQQHFDLRFDRLEQYMLMQQQQQEQRYKDMQSQLQNQMKQQHNEAMALMESMNAQLAAQQEEQRTERIAERTAPVTTDESNVDETVEQERVVSCDEESVDDERTTKPAALEAAKEQTSDTRSDEAAEKEEEEAASSDQAEAEDARDGAREEERIHSETQEQDTIEQESQAIDEAGDERGAKNDDDATPDAETAKETRDVEQAEIDTGMVEEAAKDRATETSVDAALEQAGSEPTAETEPSLDDETIGQGSDDKPEELPIEGNEADSVNLLNEHTDESPSDAAVPEKRPVMEERNDAIEIPDLLSDFTTPEANQAENDDQDSPS